MIYRSVRKTLRGTRTMDGAGVHLVRVVGHGDVEEFDPFLLLDAFDSTDPDDYIAGFPWHPHRGIETVTFLVQGRIDHGDSLGNSGTIEDGACQWMTAGSGIIHQEMPQPAPRMLGLQLWINLPAALKMSEPRYRDLRPENIPTIARDGTKARVIAGSFGGKEGARAGDYVDASMLDLSLEAGSAIEVPTRPEYTAFAYVLEGEIVVDSGKEAEALRAHEAALFERGDAIRMLNRGNGVARLVVFIGRPLKEPIAWGGPIVMNTREELDAAYRELENGSFIKRR